MFTGSGCNCVAHTGAYIKTDFRSEISGSCVWWSEASPAWQHPQSRISQQYPIGLQHSCSHDILGAGWRYLHPYVKESGLFSGLYRSGWTGQVPGCPQAPQNCELSPMLPRCQLELLLSGATEPLDWPHSLPAVLGSTRYELALELLLVAGRSKGHTSWTKADPRHHALPPRSCFQLLHEDEAKSHRHQRARPVRAVPGLTQLLWPQICGADRRTPTWVRFTSLWWTFLKKITPCFCKGGTGSRDATVQGLSLQQKHTEGV